ncbi:MAG: DUF5703 family protein [Cellulomonas sp.]
MTETAAVRSLWSDPGTQSPHYEFRVLSIPRSTSRGDASKRLTDEAEYGRWELARVVLSVGGERRVTLRRKIIRVRSTLDYTTG